MNYIGKQHLDLDKNAGKCLCCGKKLRGRCKKYPEYCKWGCWYMHQEKLSNNKVQESRFKVFERDKFRCVYCGKSSVEDSVKLILEHVYPRSKGGTNDSFNVVTACDECNLLKKDGVMPEDVIHRVWSYAEQANNKFTEEELKQITNSFNGYYETWQHSRGIPK